jgi:predicted amidohydrolase YtcJ
VLDVLSEEAKASKTQALRHRVEHAQVLRREDIPRFAEHGLIASMQPTHATSDMAWAASRLGPERVKGAYAWQSLQNSGAVLAFGSDFPIESADPRLGIYAARTRQNLDEKPVGGWLPEERLTGDQALRAFTAGAAYAAHAEERRGVLKEGMDADFVAFDTDLVSAPARDVPKARVLLSVVGGRQVYRAEAR